jgi:AI-2 transport protein TqsA
VEGLWIWVLGIDFAFVWGLLFFVLNFVPNIGSIVAAVPPILMAFVQFGPGHALMLAVGLLGIEQFIGNFIDPKIQGRALQVSPAVVLVSIIFWTWAWGVPGAFLAMPITIALMMVFSQVESLQPLAILLSRPGNDEVLKRSN